MCFYCALLTLLFCHFSGQHLVRQCTSVQYKVVRLARAGVVREGRVGGDAAAEVYHDGTLFWNTPRKIPSRKCMLPYLSTSARMAVRFLWWSSTRIACKTATESCGVVGESLVRSYQDIRTISLWLVVAVPAPPNATYHKTQIRCFVEAVQSCFNVDAMGYISEHCGFRPFIRKRRAEPLNGGRHYAGVAV